MLLKVKKGELVNLSDKLDEETSNLQNEIDCCIADINNIASAYKSSESDYIIKLSEAYLENLKLVPMAYTDLNNMIKKSNRTYTEKDQSFKSDLVTESGEKYE